MNPSPDMVDNMDIDASIARIDDTPVQDTAAIAQDDTTASIDSATGITQADSEERSVAQTQSETEETPDEAEDIAPQEQEEQEEQEESSEASTLLEIVSDATSIIAETVTTASNVIATNPETVDNIVSDATDALATTAAIATGAPSAPHFGRLFTSIASLIRNLFHLFDKAREE